MARRMTDINKETDNYRENSQQTHLCGARSGSPQKATDVVRPLYLADAAGELWYPVQL